MKKSYLLIAAATLGLASCTSDDFLGLGNVSSGNGEISFASNKQQMTRATGGDAAALLDNQFVVWGEKDADTDGQKAGDGKLVFTNYKVEYETGTEGTTEDNTSNWYYVGLTPYDDTQVSPALTAEQSIKYWDYTAANYVFNAFSAPQAQITNGAVSVKKTESGSTKYNKGYTVTLDEGAEYDKIYFADRLPVAKSSTVAGNKYGDEVTLTFRAGAAKVRFAVYETVPGYSVQITKVYYTDNTTGNEAESVTNFAIDGAFTELNGTQATMTVTYYDADAKDASGASIENQPKVTVSGGDAMSSKLFGETNVGDEVLGTSAPEATYDKAEKAYTVILPNVDNTTPMNLKVDYKLTSTDGSGEVINVKHATAVVPHQYCQWQSNFAYTYIFKISENTNGTTGDPGDPDDPTKPSDPTGLYPITFDAVVEDVVVGDQQTITTIAAPSITTYSKGREITENEYRYSAANPVYVAVKNGTSPVAVDLDNSKIYRAYQLGKQEITEKSLQKYADYGIILEEVTASSAEALSAETKVPMADGTEKTINVLKFTPQGGIYVFEYTNGTEKAYKVIKCDGTAIAHSYAWGSDVSITSSTSLSKTITLKDNGLVVTGAANKITVTAPSTGAASDLKITESATAGTYNIEFTADALKAGHYGEYTIKIGDDATAKVTVSDMYTLSKTSTTIAGGASETITLTDGTNAIAGAVTEKSTHVTVTDAGSGNYTLTVAGGAPAETENVKIAGKTVAVTITAYTITADDVTMEYNETSKAVSFTIDPTGVTPSVTGGISGANITAVGASSFTTDKGGVYTIAYNGYTKKVTVNQYTATISTDIASTKGNTKLTVKLNDAVVKAETGKVSIVKGGPTSSDVVTGKFTITENGNAIKIQRNGAVAGTYTVKYTVDSKVVAVATLKVTSNPSSSTEGVNNGSVTW